SFREFKVPVKERGTRNPFMRGVRGLRPPRIGQMQPSRGKGLLGADFEPQNVFNTKAPEEETHNPSDGKAMERSIRNDGCNGDAFGAQGSLWHCPAARFTKMIVLPGWGLERPREGSMCHLRVWFMNGDEVGPVPGPPYQLGGWRWATIGEADSDVAVVFESCLESMRKGERCVIGLMKNAGGWHGWQVNIQGEDELKCEKSRGVKLFGAGAPRDAARRFGRAIRLLVCTRLEGEVDEELALLYANLAACHLSLGCFRLAERSCNLALSLRPELLKALYRRGRARLERGDLQAAREDLERVLVLEPCCSATKRMLALLREREKAEARKMGQALRKMFS
uniref:FKBP prolyl isomerase like n=1 Tax=Eptatretus burgeri TaxID=7764 RepID=A0A8C4QX95_EPTBU